MIYLEKVSQNSITIHFDWPGLVIVTDTLYKCLNDSSGVIKFSDEVYFKLYSKTIKEIKFVSADTSLLKISDNVFIIQLDNEDLNYFIFRMNQCVKEKMFFPAEIINLHDPQKKGDLYIQAIYHESSGGGFN